MNTPSQPMRLDLGRARREARQLHRACLAGDPEAARRLAAAFPEAAAREIALAKAQAVLARELGFPSWPAMKADIDAGRATPVAEPAAHTPAAIDAEALAEQWFALAEAGELRALDRAMAVRKGRMEAARTVMRRSANRYAAFQGALVAGLESRRERVRFGCAAALDQFGDASTRAPLARLMDDPVPRVRWMAMHALSCHACGDKPGALEDHIRERIIAATREDPSPRVRRHAAFALALARETKAVPALREMLARETDRKLLMSAEWALAELTRPAKGASPGV